MPFITEEDWKPVGVSELEPKAEEVVRSGENCLVVAGPGAGKTELLAQRANFLLRTGRCSAPRRILAIAFKRDAARNLKSRVRERCPDEADRFDSMTLDAFAKRIVDRFLLALPRDWRPNPSYQVLAATVPVEDAELWLAEAPIPDGQRRPEVRAWTRDKVRRVFDAVMHGEQLPYDVDGIQPLLKTWGLRWWRQQLQIPAGQPSLTFPMLNRLAAYLLRRNPKIAVALRQTYVAVFLDEFQDTTASQWDLVRASFLDSNSVLTAVGDSKQRIMVWAGAKTNVFESYQEDFGAERVDLIRNYRSVPALVRMQHIIAKAVEAGSVQGVAALGSDDPGTCSILEFRTPEQEATYLADLIRVALDEESATPRDFCILVRQKTKEMVATLQEKLRIRGIALRDESTLQDLLAEPLTEVVANAIRIGTRQRDADAWSTLLDQLGALSGLDEERDGARLERLGAAHKACVHDVFAEGRVKSLPRRIVEIVGEERYRSTYRQYVNGDLLENVLDRLGTELEMSLETVGDPNGLVDNLFGVEVVPAMTIHKSKGLEFETVIFLGLEDNQWWAFRGQPEEEKRAFFVAFSRAIRRVLFTFSDKRGRRRQAREKVDALHQILKHAGVPTLDVRDRDDPHPRLG